MDRSRATNFLVVLAAIALIMNLTPTAQANAVTACTLNQLVPQVSDTSVIQGVGAANGTGGYATLARGKETLVRFYLTLPSASLCTVGSTQSIKITSASTP